MTKITPFLWFEDKAEEAIDFYASVFKDSKVGSIRKLGDYVPGPKGKILTATITLCGQDFYILNGGPVGDNFKFNEAISFFVEVDTQEEVDYYWNALTEGGSPGQCGWLKDKYGLSWQIVPKALGELMGDSDPAKVERVTKAMLKMTKLDVAQLEKAAEQR